MSLSDTDAALVRHQLAAMSQAQEQFFLRFEERVRANNNVLLARLESIDEHLDSIERKVGYQSDLIANLNTIVSGVRSATQSAYDMATSTARDLKRALTALNVPDVLQEVDADELPSERPPRSVR